MAGHSILFNPNGSKTCTCGKYFPASDPLGPLDHALPLNTRSLADQVAADPESSPELIQQAESLAAEAASLRRRES